MRVLVVEAGGRLCALPLSDVVETMRPLPVAAMAEMPAFVRGVAVIRGEPTPVVDLAALVGAESATSGHAGPGLAGPGRSTPGLAGPGRYVTVRCGARRVALAVAAVDGIHAVDLRDDGLPPLLAEAGEQIDHLATLDHQLLLILRTGRLLPPSLLQQFDATAPVPEPAQP